MNRQIAAESVLALGMLVGSAGCHEGQGAQTETMTIAHHRAPCVGLGPRLCYLTEDGLFYDGVAGWEFEWGYQYRLEVEIHEIENPPADGSSFEYSLVAEPAKERVPAGTAFPFVVFDKELIVEPAPGAFSLAGERDLDCATDGLCDELSAALQRDKPCVELRLSHPASNAAPLRLEALTPYSGRWGC